MKSLDLEAVNDMVAGFIKQDVKSVLPLSEIVLAKTLGNPYHIVQYMELLQERSLIWCDDQDSPLRWELSAIQSETNVTDNVVNNILSERIAKVRPKARSILQVAACLAFHFETNLLYAVAIHIHGHIPQEAFDRIIKQALKQRFLEAGSKVGFLKFTHDKVQEALYNMLADGARCQIHYRIGRVLFGKYRESPGNESLLFGASHHLNVDLSLITSPKERREVAELNFYAAELSKRQSSFPQAVETLKKGLALLGPNRWEMSYELALSMCTLLAEMEMFTGSFNSCSLLSKKSEPMPRKLTTKFPLNVS